MQSRSSSNLCPLLHPRSNGIATLVEILRYRTRFLPAIHHYSPASGRRLQRLLPTQRLFHDGRFKTRQQDNLFVARRCRRPADRSINTYTRQIHRRRSARLGSARPAGTWNELEPWRASDRRTDGRTCRRLCETNRTRHRASSLRIHTTRAAQTFYI